MIKISKEELKEMILNENTKTEYEYTPKSRRELKSIIKRLLYIRGDNCDLNIINTMYIDDMNDLFKNSQFTGDISKWDVSKVKDMNGMFYKSDFNGDISKWNVKNVRDMSYMFKYGKFNKKLNKWNINPKCKFENFNDDINSYEDFVRLMNIENQNILHL